MRRLRQWLWRPLQSNTEPGRGRLRHSAADDSGRRTGQTAHLATASYSRYTARPALWRRVGLTGSYDSKHREAPLRVPTRNTATAVRTGGRTRERRLSVSNNSRLHVIHNRRGALDDSDRRIPRTQIYLVSSCYRKNTKMCATGHTETFGN